MTPPTASAPITTERTTSPPPAVPDQAGVPDPVPPPTPLPAASPERRWRAAVDGVDWAGLTWTLLFAELAARGRADLPLARLAEGHIDALRILRQAGRTPEVGALYGVWASRSRGRGLVAERRDAGWRISGTMPFASGAGRLDRALVATQPTDGRAPLLLDVPVRDWPFDPDSWPGAGMAASRSFTVTVRDVIASRRAEVGPPGFYTDRPGFHPGGVGVAAVWWGGAARVADLVVRDLAVVPEPSDWQWQAVGRMRIELATAGAVLGAAAAALDAGADRSAEPAARVSATEARAAVSAAARRVLADARDLAGPAGLGQDGALSHAIDDLEVYVRQQHAARDAEFLGRASITATAR